jgi:hypothetical protein
MDGMDGVLWYYDVEGWEVRGECEEDEGIDCDDGDSDNDWKR